MQGVNKCPICHGLEKKYRIGLDEIYKTATREEYDTIVPQFAKQIKEETLVIQELNCFTESSGNVKVTLFARCSNCKATWRLEQQVVPVIGDR